MIAEVEPPQTVRRLRVLVAANGVITVEQYPVDITPRNTSVKVMLAIDTEVTRSDDPFCCHKTTWRRHYDQASARHPQSRRRGARE